MDATRFALGAACCFVCFTMVLVIFLAAVSCFLREPPKLRSLRGAVVSEPLEARKVTEEDAILIFAIACAWMGRGFGRIGANEMAL